VSRRDLERYAGLFAARTRTMTSSAMRDLMALTERPEVISLAGGLPDTSTFPPELYAKLHAVLAGSAARALQYGPTDGVAPVKGAIEQVMRAEGVDIDPDDVLVTTGGQQVIDLVAKVLLDPGDVVVAEGPTYPGALPTFSAYQADVVQVPVDADGLRVDELEETLDALERDGRRPKFIYTVPTFANPSGVTLSLPRRERLVRIAHERELLVLEDNPYGLLRYDAGERLPTLLELDGGHFVVYLGTFSKILSPGLRLGWAVAPGPVLDKLNVGKQGADLCSSPMTQLFVAEYFESGHWPGYLASLVDLYRRRRDAMLGALAESLPPEATWTRPAGGLFVWATLPDYIDTTDLLARALRENVAFVPGRAAYADGRGGSEMRLNFSGVDEADIREGVRRIGEVVREQVALYGTFTGGRPPAAEPSAEPASPGNVVPLARRPGEDDASRRAR
jgi:2-aminoadipate transaminase